MVDFYRSYEEWTKDSAAFLLQYPRQAVFMASYFTDWRFNRTAFYKPSNQGQTDVRSVVEGDRWSLGEVTLRLNADKTAVTHMTLPLPYLGGALATPVALWKARPMPFSVSRAFTRGDGTATLTLREEDDSRWTPKETWALEDALNLLPSDHLTGLKTVHAKRYDWYFRSPELAGPGRQYENDGDTLFLFLMPAWRAFGRTLFFHDLYLGIGQRVYRSLSAADKAAFAATLAADNTARFPDYRENAFSSVYNQWTQRPLISQIHGAIRFGDRATVQNLLFMASFFIDDRTRELLTYTRFDGVLSPMRVPIARTPSTLTLGQYEFRLEGSRLTGTRENGGAWVAPPTPIEVPQRLLFRLAAQ